ncbi:MAG: type II toxin-antitoxin system RelE/ParE family toxin [Bryobacteraceae bacterium]|nr:type II toxin-antitoxin system RelE/ParE family toxin [Bryobacteraceae bacterium]
MDHYVHLAEQAGEEVAERFLQQAEESFRDLASHPAMGAPLSSRAARFEGLRKWRVKQFENFLIFYLPRPDGVSIIRILHATRDWWDLLEVQ